MGSKVFTATMFFLIGVLAACGGSSGADGGSADGGLTEAQVNKLIDEKLEAYEQRIADLEAAVQTLDDSVNVVVARSSASANAAGSQQKSRAQKLAAAEAIGCAAEGYLPANQFTGEYIQCTTSQGFLVDVPKAGGMPRWIGAWYETADCSGTPYVQIQEVIGAHGQGGVFSYWDMMGKHVGYFPAEATLRTVTIQSVYSETDGCDTMSSTSIRENMIEVLPHEVASDGVNSTTGAMNEYPASVVQ